MVDISQEKLVYKTKVIYTHDVDNLYSYKFYEWMEWIDKFLDEHYGDESICQITIEGN